MKHKKLKRLKAITQLLEKHKVKYKFGHNTMNINNFGNTPEYAVILMQLNMLKNLKERQKMIYEYSSAILRSIDDLMQRMIKAGKPITELEAVKGLCRYELENDPASRYYIKKLIQIK